MRSEVFSIHTAALFAEGVAHAAELLRAGEVVALPTETVYGLAANAWNADAVRRIYEIKGRPPENPIIVHVAGIEMARQCVSEWPPLADKMAAAFWPGPLTLVLPRSREIPSIVTAGGETVGVRWPSHPFIQAVIAACGFPLAAPSANRANELSPTNAEHVRKSLETKIPLIIDGSQSQVGIESTVLDVSCSPPRLLRPGMIHAESLLRVIGNGGLETGAGVVGKLRSPGMMPRHYSPKAKLIVVAWTDEKDLLTRIVNDTTLHRIEMSAPLPGSLPASQGEGVDELQDGGRVKTKSVAKVAFPLEKIHIVAHTQIPLSGKFGRVAVIPHDAEAYARAIYAELHQCDETGAELIVVEAVPDGREWRGIADRLSRAAQSTP